MRMRRRRNAHRAQQFLHALAQCAAADALMVVGRLGDLAVDAEQRVQRRHRILQDHGDRAPADAAHLARVFFVRSSPGEVDAAAGDARRRRQQADDRQAGGGLAAARFADQAEGLAFIQGEADAVDGLDDARSAERGEVRLQVGNFEQRGHGRCPWRSHHRLRCCGIEADAQPVAEQLRRQHDQQDAKTGKDRQPPIADHQHGAAVGQHRTPGRLRRRHADTEESSATPRR